MKDIDDLTMDDFMEMTEEQTDLVMREMDRRWEAQQRRFEDWYRRQPEATKIAYHRREHLRWIRIVRGHLRGEACRQFEFMRETQTRRLRHHQHELVKLRVWRSTGMKPGSA